jgi:Flp pilus assembly protein TadG
MKPISYAKSLISNQNGASILETALIAPILLLVLVGAIDFGRGYYAALEVSSAAEAGALYGTQFPTDVSGMIKAATLDAADIIMVTPTAAYGCECSDGTAVTPNCGSTPTCSLLNVVNYVEVDTTATYKPIISYPGFTSSLTLHGKARLRASHY